MRLLGALSETNYRAELVHIACVLGTGECGQIGCEGCAYEKQEAVRTAWNALGYSNYDEFVAGEFTQDSATAEDTK